MMSAALDLKLGNYWMEREKRLISFSSFPGYVQMLITEYISRVEKKNSAINT